MKIEIDEDYSMRLKEVFNSVIFETAEGEELIVCMRDGGFEIAVRDTSVKNPDGNTMIKYHRWYTANSSGIEQLAPPPITSSQAQEL